MKRTLALIVFFFAVVNAASAQQTGQAGAADVGVAAAVARPADEATVGDLIPLYKVSSAKLEDLEKLKTPEVQFVFGDEPKKLTDLSPTVRDILDRHWKKALKFFYDDYFFKPLTAQEYYDRNIEWLKACNRTHNELVQTEIAAPQGKRKISYTEAEKTFGFINRAAMAVIERAKKVKAEKIATLTY